MLPYGIGVCIHIALCLCFTVGADSISARLFAQNHGWWGGGSKPRDHRRCINALAAGEGSGRPRAFNERPYRGSAYTVRGVRTHIPFLSSFGVMGMNVFCLRQKTEGEKGLFQKSLLPFPLLCLTLRKLGEVLPQGGNTCFNALDAVLLALVFDGKEAIIARAL